MTLESQKQKKARENIHVKLVVESSLQAAAGFTGIYDAETHNL